MSFSDTIFLFFLALVLFGPKKLPEMARQAGKLLAELRRASNEFRSQIETEIAHLEVEKQAQAVLPPAGSAEGTVASMSLNPAASAVPEHTSSDSLGGPAATDAVPDTATPTSESSAIPASSPAAEQQASQESHV